MFPQPPDALLQTLLPQIYLNTYFCLLYTSLRQCFRSIRIRCQLNLLPDESQTLNEVVVIGYGSARKRDLTGAVMQVKSAQLENESPSSMQDLLRANVPGLSVGFSAGPKPGGSLLIRGKNSINAGTDPLIVLDGVIYPGDLADINPNDIEPVSYTHLYDRCFGWRI